MGNFVNYRSNTYKDLSNLPTNLVLAEPHVLWINAIIICNRGSAPMRFNLQKARLTGLTLEKACYAATTVNLVASYDNLSRSLTNTASFSVFSLDGTVPPLNSRILVKNQAAPFQNGIYVLTDVGSISTPWILIRAVDFDTAATINKGDVIPVLNGVLNKNTKWNQTAIVNNIGVDPIVFSFAVTTNTFIINELEIAPYKTIDIIDITGVLQLQYNITPFISDSLIGFSNGYTQIFDCDVNFAELIELPF